MVISQGSKVGRTPSGGRFKAFRKKRLYEKGRKATHTLLEPLKRKQIKQKGGGKKTIVLTADTVNLFNPKTKKFSQTKIKTVSGNPANRHFVRRNIMTKGAIVETEQGKAKITSRPGQNGSVNAVLIE